MMKAKKIIGNLKAYFKSPHSRKAPQSIKPTVGKPIIM
jgi:hypothetical protein